MTTTIKKNIKTSISPQKKENKKQKTCNKKIDINEQKKDTSKIIYSSSEDEVNITNETIVEKEILTHQNILKKISIKNINTNISKETSMDLKVISMKETLYFFNILFMDIDGDTIVFNFLNNPLLLINKCYNVSN